MKKVNRRLFPKSRGRNVGDRIIKGLSELRDALKSGRPLDQQFTVRKVEITEPEEFGPARIRALREQLHVSQSVFAQLLGVSRILVQSWEQGVREPSPLARRLLTEIRRDPCRWQRMIAVTEPMPRARRKSA